MYKNKSTHRVSPYPMVPGEGVEPPWAEARGILETVHRRTNKPTPGAALQGVTQGCLASVAMIEYDKKRWLATPY